MLIIRKSDYVIIAKITTNHSMSLDDAIDLMADEYYEHEPGVWTDDPDVRINDVDCWYDDLDLISEDSYKNLTDKNDVTLEDFEAAVDEWLAARQAEYPDEHYAKYDEPYLSQFSGGIWIQGITDEDDPESPVYSLCGWEKDSLDLDIHY